MGQFIKQKKKKLFWVKIAKFETHVAKNPLNTSPPLKKPLTSWNLKYKPVVYNISLNFGCMSGILYEKYEISYHMICTICRQLLQFVVHMTCAKNANNVNICWDIIKYGKIFTWPRLYLQLLILCISIAISAHLGGDERGCLGSSKECDDPLLFRRCINLGLEEQWAEKGSGLWMML